MENSIKTFSQLKYYYLLYLLVCILCSFLLIMATYCMSELTAFITDEGIHNSSSLIFKTISLFGLYELFSHLILKVLNNKIDAYLRKEISLKISDAIIESCTNSIEEGSFYSLIQDDVDKSITFLADTFPNILYQITRLGLVILYIFYVNVYVSVIYVVSGTVSIIVQRTFSRAIYKSNLSTKMKENKMNAAIHNVLENRLVLKLHKNESYVNEIYKDDVDAYTHSFLATEAIALPFRMIGIFVWLFPILSICVIGYYMILKQVLSFASFMSIYYICQYIVYDQLHFADYLAECAKSQINLDRVMSFISVKKEEKEEIVGSDICMEDVSFCYANSAKPVISNLSLKIHSGSKVAIIGERGSGKTTVLNLIAGILKPTTGIIHSEKVTYMPQFPYLFTDTLKNNVTCWKDIDIDEYNHILKLCNITDFLDQLPQQDNTILYDNASNLSGGQKQRIALSRVLLNHEQIILFDESFSALDSYNANEIIERIIQKYKKTTMLFSIHQLELLKNMDRIIEMKNGKIRFDGTYKEWCTYEEK